MSFTKPINVLPSGLSVSRRSSYRIFLELRTDPCGTPLVILLVLEYSFASNSILLSDKYYVITPI